ncbi:unnamed protein product [Notodromas monacha]|uniref:Peptidase S1 domain-containing protein n=1 Tax=Notodromas monacha TaxID=399045 RepID=A0A7R9BWZ6_9CRUS|nr:unnamed protein product [Notodromas monacha]CAG0921944.1 unnamed protein product [Notodromas monacha]
MPAPLISDKVPRSWTGIASKGVFGSTFVINYGSQTAAVVGVKTAFSNSDAQTKLITIASRSTGHFGTNNVVVSAAHNQIQQIIAQISNRLNTSSGINSSSSRIEGGVAETDITNAPYFARVDATINVTMIPIVIRYPWQGGSLISKRHVLTTGWYIDPKVFELSSLTVLSLHVTLGGTSMTSPNVQDFNVTLSNVIRHPGYVFNFDYPFIDQLIKNQPAILYLPSDAVLGVTVKTIPIIHNAGATYIGQGVTILDWNRTESDTELQHASYVGVECNSSSVSLGLQWSLCFELQDSSASNVNDEGVAGSPVVVNYASPIAAIVGVKTTVLSNLTEPTKLTTIASRIMAFVPANSGSCRSIELFHLHMMELWESMRHEREELRLASRLRQLTDEESRRLQEIRVVLRRESARQHSANHRAAMSDRAREEARAQNRIRSANRRAAMTDQERELARAHNRIQVANRRAAMTTTQREQVQSQDRIRVADRQAAMDDQQREITQEQAQRNSANHRASRRHQVDSNHPMIVLLTVQSINSILCSNNKSLANYPALPQLSDFDNLQPELGINYALNKFPGKIWIMSALLPYENKLSCRLEYPHLYSNKGIFKFQKSIWHKKLCNQGNAVWPQLVIQEQMEYEASNNELGGSQ